MVAAAAGHELDADGLVLAEQIASETDGNPFFVGEILRSLVESGRLLYDEATERWTVDRSEPTRLPDSARDVIMRRVERLGDETGDLLTVAAVIGRSFDLELLERLTDRGGELLDRLETAVDASLLDESAERIGRFRFVHSLINQALYETLGATRRSSMHHRVAVALEELYGQEPADHVAELALHWRLAAVDGRKAGRYSAQAGRRALDSLAPDEAANLFTDALDMLGPDEDAERCRTLIGLGEAQQLIGDAAYRTTLLDAARIASSLGDADLAADAALANTRGFNSLIGDLDDERVDAIGRALELDDGSDSGRRAKLLGAAVAGAALRARPHEAAGGRRGSHHPGTGNRRPKSQGTRAAARVPRAVEPRHDERQSRAGTRPARERSGNGGSRARVLGQPGSPSRQLRDRRLRACAGSA